MKILDWKQGNLVGLEVPMSGKIWVVTIQRIEYNQVGQQQF